MSKLLHIFDRPVLAALAILFLCADVSAATLTYPFTGRWRMDTSSIKGAIKPTVIDLTGGFFQKDKGPAIKADGEFHPFVGSRYVDERSITVKSDHVIVEVDRVHGKLAYIVEYIVSPDGQTLTWNIGSYTNPNGQEVKSVTVQRRVGPPVKGSHLVTGKWERITVEVDSKSDWILELSGNRFSWRTEYGTGYDAVIGGVSAKIDGDNAGARALVTRPRPDSVVETGLSSKGKRETVMTMQLLPDQNTLRCTAFYVKTKKSTVFYLRRVSE